MMHFTNSIIELRPDGYHELDESEENDNISKTIFVETKPSQK